MYPLSLLLLLLAAHLSSSAGGHQPRQASRANTGDEVPQPLPFVHRLYGKTCWPLSLRLLSPLVVFPHTGAAENANDCMKPLHGPAEKEPYKIAVGLFGLSRNMSLTVGSFRRHVFDVLRRNNIRFDVFWSTMVTNSFSNARTKESGVRININDYKLVSPCRYAVYNQDTIKEKLYTEYRRHTDHDPWNDGFVCLRNVLCSYYSQMKLSEMISSHARSGGLNYDAVLILRPDTAVISDIDLPRHLPWIAQNPSARVLWIPDFHSYLGYNDRAVFGSPENVHTYLSRGSFYLNASFGFDKNKGSPISSCSTL